MKKLRNVLVALVMVVLLIGGAGFAYVYSKLDSIYVKDVVAEASDDNKDEAKMVEGVTNVLLVGIDGRNIEKGNRSDSVMLATMNANTKQIKITSIARDTYVEIPGYGYEKMTHAYAYGGIDLLREVFKVNFDIDVDKYVAVNFVSFMDVMDELGGVEVDVTPNDVDEVNKYIDDCYEYYYDRKDDVKKEYVTESGVQRLNGYQALAFSRIRYNDDAFKRENRHREIAESVYKEFLESGSNEYKRCADIVLDNTKTNLSPMEMIDLGFTAFKVADTSIDQLQFPMEEYRNGHVISKEKGWVLEWDKEPNLEALHKFIFE